MVLGFVVVIGEVGGCAVGMAFESVPQLVNVVLIDFQLHLLLLTYFEDVI